MTSDAVRVVLYVDQLGPAGVERSVKGEDLSILIHGGEKPIRAAIKRAEHCGYLVGRFGGRAGHKLTLTEENASPGAVISHPGPEGMTPPGEAFSGNGSPRGGNSAPLARAVIPPSGELLATAAATTASAPEDDPLPEGFPGPDDEHGRIVHLLRAFNRGVIDNPAPWAKGSRPLTGANDPTGYQALRELLHEGVGPGVALATLYEAARGSPKPVSSASYFRERIREAWEARITPTIQTPAAGGAHHHGGTNGNGNGSHARPRARGARREAAPAPARTGGDRGQRWIIEGDE